MEVIYRNQINIMTFVLLAFIFVIAFRYLEKSNPLNRAFLFVVAGVMLGLFAESTTVFFNHHDTAFAILMNNAFSVVIFALAPMISFYFFVFIYHLVMPGKRPIKLLWILFMIPILSNVILAILSPFFGFFFEVTELGVYVRGPLFLLSAFSTYLPMCAGIIVVIINYKRLLKQDFWLILGIGIVPILGGIAQSLVYGILAMWSSAGVALILGYLFLQERMIRLDSLTGAWNRESFYFTYTRRIQLTPDKAFGAIYFDIDNLKMINDTFGHLEGDKAIKLVMEIVRNAVPIGGIVCRLGGDEFLVLYDCDTLQEINEILKGIKEEFSINKDVSDKEYPITCSFGTALFTSEYSDLNAFMSKLDILMYKEKNAKKRLK